MRADLDLWNEGCLGTAEGEMRRNQLWTLQRAGEEPDMGVTDIQKGFDMIVVNEIWEHVQTKKIRKPRIED